MTHPLTNRILVDLYQKTLAKQSQTFPVDFMRSAADWQLEKDAEYWTIVLNKAKFVPPQTVDYIIEEFKQAMRPQEDNQ